MHYHARVRVAFLVVALLGLLPRALPAITPGEDWYFVPPDARPALLLEARKHPPKQPDGVAFDKEHDFAQPKCIATSACLTNLPATRLALFRYTPLLRPEATGPPA